MIKKIFISICTHISYIVISLLYKYNRISIARVKNKEFHLF